MRRSDPHKRGTFTRFFWYRIYSGERLFGLKRHNNLHLYGRRNVWFLYPYKTTCMAGGMSGSFIRIKRSARHTACGTMIPKE